MRLREFLREQVRASGLTQAELARCAGLSEKHVSQMMRHNIGGLGAWQKLLDAADVDL